MEQEMSGNEDKPYVLWLCGFPGIGNRRLCRLIELCGSAERVYHAGRDRWRQVLSDRQAEALEQYTEGYRPREKYAELQRQGIRLVTLADGEYPRRLREIPDAPYGLFVRGQLPDEGPAAAVIGARDCSQYGRFVAEKLGEALGRNGVTVVSGMARGIDGISQQAALNAGGRSCAVLGCGVDICYPAQNRGLYEMLPRQGCLMSSYPPGTPALSRNFPPRNRIVSGLADVVVVVEAREKSGTLITVDMALEQGREVYAVPGRITDRLSDGCNRLIRQGAVPLLNPEDLLEDLLERRGGSVGPQDPFAGEAEADGPADLSPELAAVYDALELTPGTAGEIRERLPEQYRDINLNVCLVGLCMKKLAVQVSPGCFCRNLSF